MPKGISPGDGMRPCQTYNDNMAKHNIPDIEAGKPLRRHLAESFIEDRDELVELWLSNRNYSGRGGPYIWIYGRVAENGLLGGCVAEIKKDADGEEVEYRWVPGTNIDALLSEIIRESSFEVHETRTKKIAVDTDDGIDVSIQTAQRDIGSVVADSFERAMSTYSGDNST